MKIVIRHTILLALITYISFACSQNPQTTNNQDLSKLQLQVDSLINIIDSLQNRNILGTDLDDNELKELGQGFDRTTGERLRVDEAYRHLEKFKDKVGRNPNNRNRPKKGTLYAFSFGIDPFNTFVEDIKAINKRFKPTLKKDSIIGVRVYYSRKNRNGTEGSDVFLIPIGHNKKNIYAIDDGFDKNAEFQNSGLILNSSAPCPEECDPQ